jgi:sulfur transfer complex TusBCD TusB component (DsrH family)
MKTEIINKDVLIYGDLNYTKAVNYRHLYNSPITLNYGEKHNRTKYIISAGTGDSITLIKDGIYIYIISENRYFRYISLEVINTEAREIENNVFLSETDLNEKENVCYNILDKDTDEQLQILYNYL